jgi:hypothetical protein
MQRLIHLVILAAVLAPTLAAQADEVDIWEVSGSLGWFTGLGSHPTVSASLANAQSGLVLPYFEASYTPLGNRAFEREAGRVTNRSSLYEFSGGVHLRAPMRPNFAPYLAVGAGVLYASSEVVANNERGTARMRDANAAFHVGAGLRYYLSSRWGVRPEVKLYLSDRTFVRATIGFFYRFP